MHAGVDASIQYAIFKSSTQYKQDPTKKYIHFDEDDERYKSSYKALIADFISKNGVGNMDPMIRMEFKGNHQPLTRNKRIIHIIKKNFE